MKKITLACALLLLLSACGAPPTIPEVTPTPFRDEHFYREALDALAGERGWKPVFDALDDSTTHKDEEIAGEYLWDFDGDGAADTLTIAATRDFPGVEVWHNLPIQLTMTISGKSYVYEDTFNDGIFLTVLDLDKNDGYMDIVVVHSGLDIGMLSYVFRYDGEKIFEYTQINHVFMPYYDGGGKIYSVDGRPDLPSFWGLFVLDINTLEDTVLDI
jgi:hypothetical protein